MLAFVLPHHAPPWMSFLQESLAAIALIVLAAPTLLRERGFVPWRLPELLVLSLLCVVAVQYLFGRIAFFQTVWMHGLFMLGLVVALLSGAALERRAPMQVLWVVLGSAWLAGCISVALLVYQWLFLMPGEGTAWVYRSAGRLAANLGQPNSVGTLILFALLATYWCWRRNILAAWLALTVSAYLVFGLALTQSRTGLLNAAIVAAALLLWHCRHGLARLRLPLVGLVAWLVVAFVGFSAVSRQIGLQLDPTVSGRTAIGSRPLAWRMFSEATLANPLAGFGWGQSFRAQMHGTLQHPVQHEVFLSTHNLLLELAVWAGLPVAIGVAVALAVWLRSCLRRMSGDDASMLMCLLLVVLFVHAMLEYPLAYAYFLLPAGLLAGALNQRLALKAFWRAPAGLGAGLLLLATVAFAATAREYLAIEQSYRELLLEKARIQLRGPVAAPEAKLLTSLRDLIDMSRILPAEGMSDAELSWMREVASTHPGPAAFQKVAMALALNGQAAEAQRWVDMLCSIFPKGQCAAMAEGWSALAEEDPRMRAIRWP